MGFKPGDTVVYVGDLYSDLERGRRYSVQGVRVSEGGVIMLSGGFTPRSSGEFISLNEYQLAAGDVVSLLEDDHPCVGLTKGVDYVVEFTVDLGCLVRVVGSPHLYNRWRFKLVRRAELSPPSQPTPTYRTAGWDIPQTVLGIPEGFTLVRIGIPNKGERYLDIEGNVITAGADTYSSKNYVIVTQDKPKTRKILLKEWIVWDVEGEERTTWSVIRPNRFNQRDQKLVSPVPWVNAVETGATREMEVPC